MKAYSESHATTYRIDIKTPNTSFLKMAMLLRSMGVENCYFMLRLDDQSLKGVDPYDPDLDEETRIRVFHECHANRWYFYREVFRVSEAGAALDVGGGTPFILNRGNLAYLWAMEMNISTYLIMPRQTGKTWAAIADSVWTHQFNRGSTILHFNKSQKDANDNLYRIRTAISMLPMYMQHSRPELVDPKDKSFIKNNAKTVINTIGATIEAMASAGNEAKADAIARGKTASKIWYDELAYIFYAEVIYSAATPAYEKATESAIKNGSPYAISITTTPGDLATPHGAFAYKMMQSSIRFDESFYDLERKKLYDIVNNTPGKVPFIFVQYSYLQLGESDDWYLYRYKKMNNPIKARREYLLEWMNSNGNSPFDPDDVELISQLAKEREKLRKVERINKYFELSIYSEYNGPKPVLIGVDVSGSLGRDASAVVVVNPENLYPMAIFRSNMIESSKLRKLLKTLVKKKYPHCVLMIENNSVGKPLIDELRETPLARVLYRQKKKRTIDQGPTAITKRRKVETIEYGYSTNSITRPQMMETLESIVHNSPAHLGFPEMFDEIQFLELKNGRIDHGASSHDDVVMAYMGALWCVRYGTGLKGRQIYYNISDGQDEYEEAAYDTRDGFEFAGRVLRMQKDVNPEKQAEADLVSWLSSEQHTQTASDLADRERGELFKAMDERDHIEPDEFETTIDQQIKDPTQRLLLKNYHAMLNYNPYDDADPIASMLAPSNVSEPYGGGDWADAYRW